MLIKKFNVLTYITYKSNFIGTEFLFGNFKNEYYKYILRDKKEQREKIIQIIESEELEQRIPSFYLQTYENYLRNITKQKNDDGSIHDLLSELNNGEIDEISKSFDE